MGGRACPGRWGPPICTFSALSGEVRRRARAGARQVVRRRFFSIFDDLLFVLLFYSFRFYGSAVLPSAGLFSQKGSSGGYWAFPGAAKEMPGRTLLIPLSHLGRVFHAPHQ